jgi:competence protein ComEA
MTHLIRIESGPRNRLRAARPAAIGLAVAMLLAACGGAATGSIPAVTANPSQPAVATAAPGATSGTTVTTVSANTASQAELVAALTAAGVPNASRWANEVMEYRPYPTDDATLQRLQDNLAKYDPDPATLAAILSALTP